MSKFQKLIDEIFGRDDENEGIEWKKDDQTEAQVASVPPAPSSPPPPPRPPLSILPKVPTRAIPPTHRPVDIRKLNEIIKEVGLEVGLIDDFIKIIGIAVTNANARNVYVYKPQGDVSTTLDIHIIGFEIDGPGVSKFVHSTSKGVPRYEQRIDLSQPEETVLQTFRRALVVLKDLRDAYVIRRSRNPIRTSRACVSVDSVEPFEVLRYPSVSEAKERTGIVGIVACCNGKRPMAGGRFWYWEDVYDARSKK